MAIFNPTLGSIRGRIGGNIFSHNKGGDYIRLGTAPTNPQSARQTAVRGIFGTLASQWTTLLSDAQRLAWNIYAVAHPVVNSLGQTVEITGLAWYIKANASLADAALVAVTDPPILTGPDALTTFSIAVTAGTVVTVTFTDVLAADEAMQLWVSLPVTPGSSPNKSQTRLLGYSTLAEASPWAATSPHAFAIDTKCVAFAARLSAEGLMSAFVSDSVIAIA